MSPSLRQRTGVASLGKKMRANQNVQTIFITCEKIVQPTTTLMPQMLKTPMKKLCQTCYNIDILMGTNTKSKISLYLF